MSPAAVVPTCWRMAFFRFSKTRRFCTGTVAGQPAVQPPTTRVTGVWSFPVLATRWSLLLSKKGQEVLWDRLVAPSCSAEDGRERLAELLFQLDPHDPSSSGDLVILLLHL